MCNSAGTFRNRYRLEKKLLLKYRVWYFRNHFKLIVKLLSVLGVVLE